MKKNMKFEKINERKKKWGKKRKKKKLATLVDCWWENLQLLIRTGVAVTLVAAKVKGVFFKRTSPIPQHHLSYLIYSAR